MNNKACHYIPACGARPWLGRRFGQGGGKSWGCGRVAGRIGRSFPAETLVPWSGCVPGSGIQEFPWRRIGEPGTVGIPGLPTFPDLPCPHSGRPVGVRGCREDCRSPECVAFGPTRLWPAFGTLGVGSRHVDAREIHRGRLFSVEFLLCGETSRDKRSRKVLKFLPSNERGTRRADFPVRTVGTSPSSPACPMVYCDDPFFGKIGKKQGSRNKRSGPAIALSRQARSLPGQRCHGWQRERLRRALKPYSSGLAHPVGRASRSPSARHPVLSGPAAIVFVDGSSNPDRATATSRNPLPAVAPPRMTSCRLQP